MVWYGLNSIVYFACCRCNSILKFELNTRLITLESTAADQLKGPQVMSLLIGLLHAPNVVLWCAGFLCTRSFPVTKCHWFILAHLNKISKLKYQNQTTQTKNLWENQNTHKRAFVIEFRIIFANCSLFLSYQEKTRHQVCHKFQFKFASVKIEHSYVFWHSVFTEGWCDSLW